MELVLFRHGEKTGFGADPELTSRGLTQAKSIAQLATTGALPRPTQIYASPRRRAQQTLDPLALNHKLKIKIIPELDQQSPKENNREFRLRIQEFLVKMSLECNPNDAIYLCTHSDWIMEFLSIIECDTDLLQSTYLHWASGQYMHFQKSDIWHLIKFSNP